jgi:1,4-alpha-glucan branching enzyme
MSPESGKAFFPGIGKGEAYKYAINSNTGEYLEKADPFAFYAEFPPHSFYCMGS